MKQLKVFSREELFTTDYNFINAVIAGEIKLREQSILYSSGILLPTGTLPTNIPFQLTLNSNPAHINVGAGLAYDKLTSTPLNTFLTPVTTTLVGGETIQITNGDTVVYDTTVGFTNSINLQDTQAVPQYTPLSTGSIGIPIIESTTVGSVGQNVLIPINTIAYFYVMYYQTVNLNNLNSYLTANAIPNVMSRPDIQTGIINYPYFTNGYAVFVTTVAPGADGRAGNTLFNAFKALFTNGSAILGSEAFCIGKVRSTGGGAITNIVQGTPHDTGLLTGDVTTLYRTIFSVNPRNIALETPLSNGSDKTSIYGYRDEISQPLTADSHFKALGTSLTGPTPENPHGQSLSDFGGGDIDLTSHRLQQHSNGIVTTNYPNLTNGINSLSEINLSAFYSTVLAGPVRIEVNLLGPSGDGLTILPEEFYINGNKYTAAQVVPSLTQPTGVVTLTTAASGISVSLLDFNFGLTTPTNIYSLIAVENSGNLNLQLVINGAEPAGSIILATYSWVLGTATLIKLTDNRIFGSINSTNIEDAAVTPNKQSFLVRDLNTRNFQYIDTTHIGFNPIGTFSSVTPPTFSMDGYYSKWLGGYINSGLNGFNSPVDGRSLVWDTTQVSAYLHAGNDLDSGVPVINNWYAVMAVQEANTNKFKLKFVTLAKVGSIASPTITLQPHGHSGGGVTINYQWGSVTDYKQAIVLTGVAKGNILKITSSPSGPSQLVIDTITTPITGLSSNDWLMLSPSSNTTGCNSNNFRYLGTVYFDSTSAIRNFVKSGGKMEQSQITLYSAARNVNGAPAQLITNLDTLISPPTAYAISGAMDITNNGPLGSAYIASGTFSGGTLSGSNFTITIRKDTLSGPANYVFRGSVTSGGNTGVFIAGGASLIISLVSGGLFSISVSVPGSLTGTATVTGTPGSNSGGYIGPSMSFATGVTFNHQSIISVTGQATQSIFGSSFTDFLLASPTIAVFTLNTEPNTTSQFNIYITQWLE